MGLYFILIFIISNTHSNKSFNFDVGGVESQVVELLLEFEKKQNVKITLLTKYSEYKSISNKLNIYQFNTFRIRILNTIYFNLRSFLKIISLNKKNKIDVIFLFRFSEYEVLIPSILNLLFKIPLFIITPTDFETYERECFYSQSKSNIFKMLYYGWMKFFKNYMLKRKRVYVQAINQHIYNDLIELNLKRDNIVLIPNGIQSNTFDKIIKVDHNKINFGYVGRLISTKNIRFLIKTFKLYLTHFPNDRLLIFGTGPEEKFISNYVKSNNLSDKILLMGFKSNKSEIYSKLDVLIHPSFGEGVPMIILEAALTNTFIIASNVKGNRDIIEHKKTGFLFDPFNQKDLLEKLLLFKNDDNMKQKIIINARENVLLNYDITYVVNAQYHFIKSKVKLHN